MFKVSKILPELDVNTKLTLSIVACFATGILFYLSIFDLAGRFGGVVASFLATFLGRGSGALPLAFFIAGLLLIRLQKYQELSDDINPRLAWGMGLCILAVNGFLSLGFGVASMDQMDNGGGLLGYIIYPVLLGRLGQIGGGFILFCVFLIGFFLISQMTFVQFLDKCTEVLRHPGRFWDFIPDIFEIWGGRPETEDIQNTPKKVADFEDLPEGSVLGKESEDVVFQRKNQVAEAVSAEPVKPKPKTKPRFSFAATADEGLLDMAPAEVGTDWKLPPFDILKANDSQVVPGDIEGNKQIIRDTLAHFGIAVEMHDTRVGPTVTQYTLKPANGVKLAAIDNLQRDLALALAAVNIRIEAPISGQSLVGIEIPNAQKSQVRLRDLLQTHQFVNFDGDLAVAIGQDVAGKNIVYSLAKMPHLLVAGATGSGKSVWVNSMLLSLLYRYSPGELQLVLVDMKRVELKLYEGVPHLLCPVITEAEKAINALKWTVLEMDRRYRILEEHGKRNIKDFNKFAETSDLEKLSYLVFVIDELGDLMMLAKAEVEPIIVRLTQMSRAVGIHLVLGMQRPDTHVVTGLIKANVPSRIAFAVASQIDSRVILDQGGAEKLLGQGDGLFVNPGSMHAIRFQGPNVEEKEVRQCVQFLKQQAADNPGTGNFNPTVMEPPKVKIQIPGMVSGSDDDSGDEVFEEARRLVIQYQKASASFLQQMMGIGYPKAARIIQQLEEIGVVGPQNGSKPREVYALPEEE